MVYFQYVKYVELDCSFCLKPYVFSIIMGILDNESIPLSFSIGPSEKSDIFQIGFNELKKYGADLTKLPILSDMGSAIEKFCTTNCIKFHFWCWRHIIESFGSRTFVSLIIRRILKCNSINDFESSLIESYLDLINLNVDENIILKFNRFVGYDYDPVSNTISKNQYCDNIKKWAIWERYAFSVATCSNHLEATHRVVKRDSKQYHSIYNKLRAIIDRLEAHVREFPKAHGRSL